MDDWVSRREEIEEEAARLLARLNLDPDEAERSRICAWIEAHPAHAVAFAKAEAAWESAERLKAFANDDIPAPLPNPRSRRLLIGGMVAASLFVAAAAVTVQKLHDVERYRTETGEVEDVTLADGSVMHLNSGSAAEVRFSENGRRVRILSGEASFDVAHDKARPFDVEAQSAVIRAVGTAFNVRMRPSLVELTVTQGTVAVRSGQTRPQSVSAGSGAVIRPRTVALTKLDEAVIDQRMAWRERMVELDGDTIEQAVAEFNRYRTTPMVIGDARVSGLRIGGRFRTTDSEDLLSALQMSLPVRAVTGPDGSIMLLYRDGEPSRD